MKKNKTLQPHIIIMICYFLGGGQAISNPKNPSSDLYYMYHYSDF